MNQILETIIKAVLVAVAILFATGTFAWPTDATVVNTLTAALSAVVAGGFDLYSTIRLRQQGVVSTDPAVNVAEEMTPKKLVADEKAEARKS